MKLIIAGGRDYRLDEWDLGQLDQIHEETPITEVVSGGCRGVDKSGECWASYNGIPVKVFPADWDAHGKAAGPIRNREMAAYADGVALFKGGRGTETMRTIARKTGIRVWDFSQ